MKRKWFTHTLFAISGLLLVLFAVFQRAERWIAKPSLAAVKAPAVQSPERYSLNVARRGHTMTALPDGRVVVIGGENENGAVAEAELLDSAATSLIVTSRSVTARSRHSATLLGDGRVLVIGGTAQGKLLSSTEWFDPATGEFSAGPRLNHARAGHAATELADGRLLVTGGNAEGNAEIFDPSAGRFTLLRAKLEDKPSFHSAVLLADGKVLVAGGVAQDGRWLRSAQLFDPSEMKFAPVAEKMWIKRVQPAMQLLPDGKVQVIGGDYDGTMEVYDPARNSFRGAAHLLPTADIFPAANVMTAQTHKALIDGLTPPGAMEKNAAGKSMVAYSPEVEAAMNSIDDSIDRTDYATVKIAGRNQTVIAGGLTKDGQLTKSVVVLPSSSAELSSDKVEYQPGETPFLRSSGWQSEERVQIVRQNARPDHKRQIFNAVADQQGNINLTLPAASYADGMTYTVTAMGESSGRVAQTVYSEARDLSRAPNGPTKIAYSFPLSFRDGSVETDAGIWIWEVASGGPIEPSRPPASPFAAPESGFTQRINFDSVVGKSCLGIPSSFCRLPSGVDVKLKQGSFLEIGGSVEGSLDSTAYTAKAFIKEKLNTDLQFDISAVGTFDLAAVTLPSTGAQINASLGGSIIGATLDFGVKAKLKLQFNPPGTTFVTGFKLNEEAQIGVEADTSGIRPILSAENPSFTPVFNVTSSNGGCIILTLGPEVSISANLTCITVSANTSIYTFAKACLTYSNDPACRARLFTVDVGIAGAMGASIDLCSTISGVSYSFNPPDYIFGQYNIYKDGPTLVGADTVPPVLNAAVDRMFVNNDPGQCSAVVEYPLPSFRDNCSGLKEGSLECSPPSGSSFPVGSTEIKCSVRDNFDNIGRTSFFVQVEDVERPVLEGSIPNITQPADPGKCSAVVNFPLPQVKDNCRVFVETSIPSGSTFPIGTTNVTVRVRQAGQTTAEWPFTVTVLDTQGPTFNSCPANITVPTDRGKCSAVVNFNLPTATDACGGDVVVTSSIKSGSTFPAGTTPVVVTATDASGNKTTCTFNVIVEDKEAPTISCPPDVTKEADPGKCSAVVNFDFTVLSANNCRDAVNFSFSHESGSAFPVGTTTVTVRASDQSGNSTSCSFTVTVVDKQGPAIACPADIVQPTDPGQCSAAVRFTPTAADGCGVASVTSSIQSGARFPIGTTPVTVTATDSAGNHSTCTFNVTVVDNLAPVLQSCPANITVNTEPQKCSAVVRFNLPTATDNCPGDVRVTSSVQSGATFQKGTTPVTVTATDAAGNQTICMFNVTVVDKEAPAIICPPDVTQVADSGQCSAAVNFDLLKIAANNCRDGITTSFSHASGSTFPIGTTTVTATATDESGNSASCSFTVTVVDKQAPTIACPANITQSTDPGQCSAVVRFAPTATDNCGGQPTIRTSIPSGTAFQKGTTPVTVTAIDAAGNQSTCTFTVTIVDNEAPVLACPANIVQSTDRGQCAAVVRFTLPAATDNCAGVTVTSSIPSASVFQKGTTPVTVTATDEAGNKTTCTFTVTVVDNELPVLNSCPANITQSTDPGQCAAVVNFALPTATDNCPGVAVTSSIPSGSVFPKGTTTVTVMATDAAGNSTACSFTVTIVDTELPEIGDASPSPAILANPDGRMRNVTINYSSTDNCPGAVNSLSVSSSESSTDTDWEIVSDHQVRLRARRNPNSLGRTYTITINTTDAAGNQALKKTVTVKVPR